MQSFSNTGDPRLVAVLVALLEPALWLWLSRKPHGNSLSEVGSARTA
jgi:hypothetical protein